MRELDQADFDLDRFVNMFDEAMTSKDPRVIETLRSLMMIVTLTRPESSDINTERRGPLRRAFEDMDHMWKRMERMEEELRQMHQRISQSEYGRWPRQEEPYNNYTFAAAAQMAKEVDADLLHKIANVPKISAQWANQINGSKWPKGKL